MNENRQHNCVVIAVLGAWAVIMLACFSCFLFWRIGTKKIKREVLMTGYAEGSIVHYKMVIFPDSTYLMLKPRHFGEEEGSYWFRDNDTIKLVYQHKVCATLYRGNYIQHYCDEFRPLSIMHFKVFNPPKEIEFYN